MSPLWKLIRKNCDWQTAEPCTSRSSVLVTVTVSFELSLVHAQASTYQPCFSELDEKIGTTLMSLR